MPIAYPLSSLFSFLHTDFLSLVLALSYIVSLIHSLLSHPSLVYLVTQSPSFLPSLYTPYVASIFYLISSLKSLGYPQSLCRFDITLM